MAKKVNIEDLKEFCKKGENKETSGGTCNGCGGGCGSCSGNCCRGCGSGSA